MTTHAACAQDALDLQYMQQALALAQKGLFTTSPNPRVGCVLVKNNQVIAEGWHQYAGQAHAEVAALEYLNEHSQEQSAEDATCYVTLEPCSHQGRTAPCTASLIAAKVKRVVIAMVDPNPCVSGKGIKQLESAGIEVKVGVLEDQAYQLNPGFIKRMTQGMPWTISKLAMSIDGKTAMGSGESKWITSSEARADVQLLRARVDAIITGTGTVAKDNPSLTVRPEQFPPTIDVEGLMIKQPLRVIVDAKGVISPEHNIIQQPGQVLIATTEAKLNELQTIFADCPKLKQGKVELIAVEHTASGKVNLRALLTGLAERGINEVLIESGANLAGAFVSEQLVDQLEIYMAPKILGHQGMSLLHLPELEQLADAYQFEFEQVRPVGQDICLTLFASEKAQAKGGH
jgi:diaminohydroxyphosphoribosylaminopyrimidine deaminase / 5-amino-6-(5-phosphoribosylamino)uracil reductase